LFVSPESLVCSTVLAVENVGRDVQQLTVKTTDVDLPTGGQGKLKRGLRGSHLLSPFFFFFWQLHWHCSWYCDCRCPVFPGTPYLISPDIQLSYEVRFSGTVLN